MKDLIERLEKATGPDHNLDDRIFAKVMGWSYPLHGAALTDWDEYNSGGRSSAYTRSIDAALTLVPEGYAINTLSIWHGVPASVTILGTAKRPFGKDRKIAFCHTGPDGKWSADAPTPALAICIAALKARDFAERDLTKMEASNG